MGEIFLTGVIETAQGGVETFKQIVSLRQKYDQKIMTLNTRAKNARKLILFMFSQPIVNTKNVEEQFGISFNSANILLKSLVEIEILKEITGFSRNRLFVLKDYLALFTK
jgi:Fic family protein